MQLPTLGAIQDFGSDKALAVTQDDLMGEAISCLPDVRRDSAGQYSPKSLNWHVVVLDLGARM